MPYRIGDKFAVGDKEYTAKEVTLGSVTLWCNDDKLVVGTAELRDWERQRSAIRYPVPPKEDVPVLAWVELQWNLELSGWYDIVYYARGYWYSYSDSAAFEDGESVRSWVYCNHVLWDGV